MSIFPISVRLKNMFVATWGMLEGWQEAVNDNSLRIIYNYTVQTSLVFQVTSGQVDFSTLMHALLHFNICTLNVLLCPMWIRLGQT